MESKDHSVMRGCPDIESVVTELRDEFGIDVKFTEKHWAIIQAAIRVFSEKGFSAGRTSEIAKQAGVSEGTIFNYFPTKHDLLRGLLFPLFLFVIRPFVLQGTQSFLNSRPETSVEEGLTRLALERVGLIKEHHKLIKTMFAEGMYHHELLEPIRQKVVPGLIEATQRVFDTEVERGEFRDIDRRAAMTVFMGMIFGHVMLGQASTHTQTPEEEDLEIRRLIDIFLHGVSRQDTKHRAAD